MKVRQLILDKMPGDILEYREPFVGGGGVFFGLGRSCKAWLNDIHPGLMAVYCAMRDRPSAFLRACRAIKPQADEEIVPPPIYNHRLKAIFEGFARDTSMDPALRYFFLNRTVWVGRVTYDPSKACRLYFSNPTGWNVTKGARLEEAIACMVGVRTTCGDFERLFDAPGKNVWIYADPPYYRDGELSRLDKQYQHGFYRADHARLQQAVTRCKHRVCISYDDHPLVREWAKRCGLYMEKASWNYVGCNRQKKQPGKELLITNYKVVRC
jgi:DNA adenine methylase